MCLLDGCSGVLCDNKATPRFDPADPLFVWAKCVCLPDKAVFVHSRIMGRTLASQVETWTDLAAGRSVDNGGGGRAGRRLFLYTTNLTVAFMQGMFSQVLNECHHLQFIICKYSSFQETVLFL